jgi:DNA-binding MarR family transcriptional regulator
VCFGFARGSGATNAYLQALGPAVRRRRGGVVLDEVILRHLLDAAEAGGDTLPTRTAEVARDLAMRLGRASEHGTALLVERDGRLLPASVADMATTLGLNRSSVHRHLQRLQAAGRLRVRGRTWTFTPGTPAAPVRGRNRARERSVAVTLGDLYGRLAPLAEELTTTAATLSDELGRDDRLLLAAGCRQLAEIITNAVDDMTGRIYIIEEGGGL